MFSSSTLFTVLAHFLLGANAQSVYGCLSIYVQIVLLHFTEKFVPKEFSRLRVLMALVQFCNIIPQLEGFPACDKNILIP